VPHPHEALAASPHHRASVYRTDESWLAARWGSPAARAIVIGGARVRPVSGRLDWLPTSRAPEGTRVLLGEYDGATRWAVLVEPRLGEDGWLGLRALLPARQQHRWASAQCRRCATGPPRRLPKSAGRTEQTTRGAAAIRPWTELAADAAAVVTFPGNWRAARLTLSTPAATYSQIEGE